VYNKKQFTKTDVQFAEKLCLRFVEIFPEEQPALLHGDLWAGNFMAVKASNSNSCVPSIFDPAVYFGHREMDIGMALLFGGFDSRFFEAYDVLYPLEQNWRQRVPLTQLYPLLVHALLFGGGYIFKCQQIIKEWGS
jgi:fructosamine-3-kinase